MTKKKELPQAEVTTYRRDELEAPVVFTGIPSQNVP